MSNNLMSIKCKCGEEFYLCKYYPSTNWYFYYQSASEDEREIANSTRKRCNELERWFDKHGRCGEVEKIIGATYFTLNYEIAELKEQNR